MMMISSAAQPSSCAMLNPEAMYDPRSPNGPRRATIVGTPVSLPAMPTSASKVVPSAVPMTTASTASFVPNPGTSRLPATITSRLTARSPQSTAKSNGRSVRRSGGTGCTPQSSGIRAASPSISSDMARPRR